MKTTTVRIRVLRPFWLGGAATEVGSILHVDPLTAWGLASKAEILDPARAMPLIAAAVAESNMAALQIEKAGQPRGPAAASTWVLSGAGGYRPPHVH